MSNWQDVQGRFEAGPKSAIKEGRRLTWRVGLSVILLVSVLGVIGSVAGWFGEAAQVAREEFGPRAALQKYEWFKDAAHQLDKKNADIEIYQTQIQELVEVPRAERDRADKQNLNQWRRELAGIKASYNALAAEYNANSEKFNWDLFKTTHQHDAGYVEVARTYTPH